jgi:FMN phosphatase YigB (HAD superfamily)
MAVPPRPYAVVDLDGVLADVRHRLHFVERRPKDWNAFFAAAPDDPLLEEGRGVVAELDPGHEIVYLTGRPERCRKDTLAWLRRYGLPEGRLVMRRRGDFRPARLTKVELLRQLQVARPVALLVDDDPEVCTAAREAGFAVLQATWMTRPASLAEAQEREGRT